MWAGVIRFSPKTHSWRGSWLIDCELVVAVDPSDNVRRNPYANERVHSLLEDYHTDRTFQVATLRMVAEHVTDPHRLVQALHRLLRPVGHCCCFDRQQLVTIDDHFQNPPIQVAPSHQEVVLGWRRRRHLSGPVQDEFESGPQEAFRSPGLLREVIHIPRRLIDIRTVQVRQLP